MARTRSAKKQALDTLQRLPERATWDDILHEMYVRKKLEEDGIAAADAGRVVTHDEVKRRFARRALKYLGNKRQA